MDRPTALELLRTLRSQGARIWAENGRLLCGAPSGSIPAELLAELRERKEELLELLGAGGRGAAGDEHVGIEKVDRGRAYPLSFAQKRIWMTHQMGFGRYAYHFVGKVDVEGDFRPESWRYALESVIARHDGLRTRIVNELGEPMQVVDSVASLAMPIVDLSRVSGEVCTAEISELIKRQRNEPFDLERAPLVRGCLIERGEQAYTFLITIHHIISDGWSVGNLTRDLLSFYREHALGETLLLPKLDFYYADYSEWQHRQLNGPEYRRQLNYWTGQLRDAPPLLSFPSQRSRPAVETFRGSEIRFQLSAEQTELVRAGAKKHGASVFMVMVAAFKVLLHLYTGSRDLVIGTIVANRQRKEVENMIGVFINTLVLRVVLDPGATFADFLGRVRHTTLEAYANQDVPFERLVEILRPARNSSHNPLFQVMVLLQNTPMPPIKLPRLGITVEEVESASAPFDLTLTLAENQDSILGSFKFNLDLFNEAYIVSLIDRFHRLIDQLLRNSSDKLRNCCMLSDLESVSASYGFNPRSSDHARKCVHMMFEARACEQAERVALIDALGVYTYGWLNRRANRLARVLIARGISLESIVGIYMERSASLIVAMLAILKAGGAYLPIDPETPNERLSYFLHKGRAFAVLTDSYMDTRLPDGKFIRLCLNEIEPELQEQADTDLYVRVLPENLAYVLFTSGSTGKPKGVCVTHRNVTRLLAASGSHFDFSPDDTWTFFHAAAFDFSVWEIWGALSTGGRLVVVPHVVSRDPIAFCNMLVDERVTILNQTPTAFSLLSRVALDEARIDGLCLRFIIFGGERLSLEKLRNWIDKFGDDAPRLINMYGITETTVHVTFKRITRAEAAEDSGYSCIGVPLDDLRVFLMNEYGIPVPPHIEGEIHVAGPGVSRGYLADPRETASRFVPTAMCEGTAWNRSYCSGDIGKNLGEKGLSFVGRKDDQCKVHGFRIELGEIEQVLLSYEGVSAAAVRVNDTDSDKLIEGYYVERVPGTVSPKHLRAYMAERLPAYMLPRHLTGLNDLPLTLNGKLDVARLPKVTDFPDSNEGKAKPATPLQRTLADIWQGILGIEGIGIDDDFFAIGGHSLAAVRLVNEARERLQCEYSVTTFFTNATIRGMADALVRAGVTGEGCRVQNELERVRYTGTI